MKKKTKQRIKKITKYTAVTTLCSGVLLFSGVMVYVAHEVSTLPKVDTELFKNFEGSKILDQDGNVIWQNTEKLMSQATYDELPELYRNGLIAIEDKDFWTNKGFSYRAVANTLIGGALSRVSSSYVARGGSTLEQQLIKNVVYEGGTKYNVIDRKIGEWFLSRQMDENYSKKDVLTMYANSLEFAENTVGIKKAAEVYFGKTFDKYSEINAENASQIAYLIGLGQAPSGYNLYTNPENGIARRNVVLSVLLDKGLISQEVYEGAIKHDIVKTLQPRYSVSESQRKKNQQYKSYTDGVLAEMKQLGYDVNKTSLTIETFLDTKLYKKVVDEVNNMKYLDSKQQIGVSVIDKDGIVKAMVGGRGSGDDWNRAMQNTRSSGSSMKPFTAYGPLLQYFGDKYNTTSMFSTDNYRYPGTNSIMYNWGQLTYGNKSVQESLRLSLNTPVARIDDEILGSTRMKTFLSGVGLDVKDTYSSVDGIGLNISTLQAAAAYNAINNKGVYTRPRFVSKIKFPDDSEKNVEPEIKQAMNESVAYVLAQILRGVPQAGSTAPLAHISEYKGYGGKTGTVAFDANVRPPAPYGQGGSDAWYDSFTNGGYSIAIWTGYDSPNNSPQIPDTYKEFTVLGKNLQQLLNGGRGVSDWSKPQGVQHLWGSDINAHYKVTDSKDIAVNTNVAVRKIEQRPTVKKLENAEKVDSKWKENLSKYWKKLYDAWFKNNSIIDEYDIQSESTYKLVRGDKYEKSE